jgi:hypothetical protein
MFRVMLGRFVTGMGRVKTMGVREMRVMTALFMVAALVMFGRLFVMVGGLRMMLGCGFVMFTGFMSMCAHRVLLLELWLSLQNPAPIA